jgi:hypothetical protein
VKGVSALFSWYISKGENVTVLSPPPPERFHPPGRTNFQAIERPILKRRTTGSAVLQIDCWLAKFGTVPLMKRRWRPVKCFGEKQELREGVKGGKKSVMILETNPQSLKGGFEEIIAPAKRIKQQVKL